MRWQRKLELLLLIAGGMMLALYGAAHIHRTVLSQAELHRFKTQQQLSRPISESLSLPTAKPDFSLWSPKRIQEYEESLTNHFDPALGILVIPKISVEVPILEGTDDLILNRGVGHVSGTASPGQTGNVAIAGHRDGFFRGLKDVVVGDKIEMVTPQGTETYTIDSIVIVERNDVSVLRPESSPSLTLITCYPFYFIGSAPQRYIVHATVTEPKGKASHARAYRASAGQFRQEDTIE
jgi:sortase A